jgi:hypothetical protein
MSINNATPPQKSIAKLFSSIEQLIPVERIRKRSRRRRVRNIDRRRILYPHPIYNVRLAGLLAGHAFSKVLRRVAWMYFVRPSGGEVMSMEVSIIGGRHKNFRVTQGAFALRVLNTIEKASHDSRSRRRSLQLRSVRVESLHTFALWLRANSHADFWIPVTPIGANFATGRWLSTKEFAALLLTEAKRVSAAQNRALGLMKSV